MMSDLEIVLLAVVFIATALLYPSVRDALAFFRGADR